MSYLDAHGSTSRCTTSSSTPRLRFATSSAVHAAESLVAPSRIALAKLEGALVGELDSHFKLKDRLAPVLPTSTWSSSTARRRSAC
jgi:hypothetical protein